MVVSDSVANRVTQVFRPHNHHHHKSDSSHPSPTKQRTSDSSHVSQIGDSLPNDALSSSCTVHVSSCGINSPTSPTSPLQPSLAPLSRQQLSPSQGSSNPVPIVNNGVICPCRTVDDSTSAVVKETKRIPLERDCILKFGCLQFSFKQNVWRRRTIVTSVVITASSFFLPFTFADFRLPLVFVISEVRTIGRWISRLIDRRRSRFSATTCRLLLSNPELAGTLL